ncbi:ABC transporter permease [Candidatus Babeliales bacterium]|nr:ABC transporter permease [Candidatus Babeliales bacterium]MCF7899145.1 ABC transporter permease [Candidatus Babeliales bacterium]
MNKEKNIGNRKKLAKFLPTLLIVLSYLFLYLPIFVLILFSFNESSVSIRWTGFSLKWYFNLFNSPEIIRALMVSLIVAFSSTILSLFFATSLVLGGRWWKNSFLNNIFYVNIVLPDIILAICILSIFSFLKIPLGYASLIVGHTIIGLGFAVPIIRSRFVEIDPLLTEASLDLGAGYVQTFIKIVLPLLKPSLIASALLVFTLSLDDFLIAFFCSSPTVQTLSVYVYSMIKTWIDPTINAVSTLLLVISSLLVLLVCSFKVVDRIISNE